ncbi:ABC transporter permease [Kiloniella litopenaei]|uniref:ABC transporter permease n=1 Tax=Kiloniella litopenaei TaxID=1549748 RepID=A0A0M2R2L9_9PROT|nr:branched-chain amino acid ABC transporter permease [Kiloniella litopenaei]KKJ76137.1 ABC transporter permease [Kiloniella litopenaei]
MFLNKILGSEASLRAKIVSLIGLVILLTVPVFANLFDEPFLVDIASRILIYALVAVSLDLILGYGGMVSFGHGAFLGLGAYVVGILTHHSYEGTAIAFLPGEWQGTTHAFIQWPLAMLLSGFLALIIGALSLRTSGVYFIMITLAFAQMLYFFMISIPTYGGEDGLNIWERSEIPLLDLYDAKSFYFTCLFLLLLCLWCCSRIVKSRFGMVLRGCRQNEVRMKALGYPVYRYKLMAFVLSGMIAGLAGALLANHTEFVGPGLMHWTRSGEIMIMVILGGMGSLIGPVLGSAALLMMEEVLAGLTEHWMIFLGPMLVLIVLFARKGLYGLLVGKGADNG